MKRVLFLAHGIGRHIGKEWAQGEIELIKQKAAALEDDEETGFEKEKLQKAVAETIFKPLNYDDKYRQYVATMFGRKAELIEEMKKEGFGGLAKAFTDKPDAENVFRDSIFDIAIYRAMKEHRNATRAHLIKQMLDVMKEHGADRAKAWYSVMAHSLGTIVIHDTLEELSQDAVFGLGQDFFFSNLFMVANTSALLRSDHDPAKSHVRPFLGPRQAGYVASYWDFAHKFDPVAQVLSFRNYMEARGAEDDIVFKSVNHFLEPNIHGFAHYLQNPRVYMWVFFGLYGKGIVPLDYVRKVIIEKALPTFKQSVPEQLVSLVTAKLGESQQIEPEPKIDAAKALELILKIIAILKELS